MRIAGITIPDKKRLEVGLGAVYGVGRTRAREVLDRAKISYDARAGKLSASEEKRIRAEIEKFKIEGDLKREVSTNIKRLKDIQSYRGSRHTKGLKVRGQRSRTNMRTVPSGIHSVRRERKTMGSGKRKVDKK